MKWFLEIVQNYDGTYYANMTLGGKDTHGNYHEPKLVQGLKEYVSFNTLKESIKDITGICILKKKELIFQQMARKKYAYIDATQPCKRGCIITLEEIKNGHKPNWE